MDTKFENESNSHGSRIAKYRHVLHSFFSNRKVHIASLCLIVVDALIVLMLLLVDLDVIPAHGSNEDEKHDNKEDAENILHYIGLSILVIFVIEVSLKMFAEGKSFFKHKLEIFDAIVVWLSFILDVVLTIAPVSRAVRDAVVLMIVFRLWRFSRLISSIFICVKKEAADELESEKAARINAEHQRDETKNELEIVKDELYQLRKKKNEKSTKDV